MENLPRLPSAGYKSHDRGPLEFESRLRREEGDIMTIAKKKVITISPSRPIKEASELMVEKGVRRLPVTSPGTGKLRGVLVTRDIIDFLGGGDKYKIIRNKHKGNFLSAINDPVRIIMNPDHPYGTIDLSIAETAKILLEKNVGGVPILDRDLQVEGIVTERDFARYLPSRARTRVEGHMTRKVVTAESELSIREGMQRMISQGFRRLPVVDDGKLIGIVTSVDMLKYFGSSEVFEHMSSGKVGEALSIGVEEIMSSDVITVAPQTDLGEAAEIMAEHDYGGLPVVKGEKLVGIITERDLLELLS